MSGARRFVSPLADELMSFLVFKRTRGCAYARPEYTLQDFDRFVASQVSNHSEVNLERLLLDWLAGKDGRKANTVASEVAVIRQFCLYLRRRDPGGPVRRREERAMTATIDLPHLVESFFRDHLQRVRGASPNTIVSYRDSLKLLLNWLADRTSRPVSALTLDDIENDQVLAFLEHLEIDRGNSVSTRNLRLAAIRGFVEHLLRHDPTRAGQYRRVLDIPKKKSKPPSVSYLEPEEMKVLLGQPDQTTRTGRAHHALMLFLYNTGARVSEALGVHRRDLHLLRPAQVRLLGKGRKERICPLWGRTADAVATLGDGTSQPDAPIFLNAKGRQLS